MKKRNLVITVILVLAATLISVFYLRGRTQSPRGSLNICYEDKEISVEPFTLSLSEVKGTVVNGKGEEKEISAKGVSVMDVLSLAGIGNGDFAYVRAVSSDEYAAELLAQEVADDGIAFLIRDSSDGGKEAGGLSIRLVVFGDSNSKRQVKDVVRIEVVK